MNDYQTITNLKSNNSYNFKEYCKILCLTEALLIIKDRDSSFDNYKRCSIKHYIDSRTEEMQRDIILQFENKTLKSLKLS